MPLLSHGKGVAQLEFSGILFVMLLGGLVFCMAPQARADQFTTTCSKILSALRDGSWDRFESQSADPIVFEQVIRVYLQQLPGNLPKRLTGSSDFINDDYLDGIQTEPADESNDRDILVTHIIPLNRKLSPDEQRAFKLFCSYVRDSYSGYHGAEQSRNMQGWEVHSLFGPAIEGKVASNLKWRVQLELVNGVWRARKLIVEAH
jgi:hypothetical protein